MDKKAVLELLEGVANGHTSPGQACKVLQNGPFASLLDVDGHGLCLDPHRGLRTGTPEVVFGQGKSPEQLAAAVSGLGGTGSPVLATRLSPEQIAQLLKQFPDAEPWPEARVLALGASLRPARPCPDEGEVMVLTAGASDRPVALEAVAAARFFGLDPGLVADAGVAGLHRLAPRLDALRGAKALVVVAGMEGALPSVVAGLTGKPIIAVPTSIGYGASFGGLAALLAMLNSCAPGIAVVNIDNGFGAAVMAAKIVQAAGHV